MVYSVVIYRPYPRKPSPSSPSVHPFPVFRTHFQVPYPVSPLFATLTKTAGVCTNNFHSGTSSRRASPEATHYTPLYSSAFFSHSCALFCTLQKLNCFVFSRFRTLVNKTPGVGEGETNC